MSNLGLDQLSKILVAVAKPVVPYIIAGLAETMLYGAHVVLLLSCAHILLQNKRRTRWFLLAPAIFMFIISTADIAITFRFFTEEVMLYFRNPSPTWSSELLPYKHPLFVANNLIAEFILIYRGYIVWNRSRYVLIGCSLVVLADTIWGFIMLGNPHDKSYMHTLKAYIWTILGINVLLTGITVARIIWISKTAGQIVAERSKRGFRVMIAVILVYCLCLTAVVVLPLRHKWRPLAISVLMRIVAITPTLLVVQIGLNRSRVVDTGLTGSEPSEQEEISEVVLDTVLTSGGRTEHSEVPHSSSGSKGSSMA